jgi:hypothetical protein
VWAVGLLGATPDQDERAEALLDHYDRGQYTAVARVLASADAGALDRIDEDLHDHVKRWIEAASPPNWRRRSFVAGALASELTHALAQRASTPGSNDRARSPAALPEISRYISDRMTEPPGPMDRLWVLASLSTWQEWSRRTISYYDRNSYGWALLLGDARRLAGIAVPDIASNDGFLTDATRRFPEDGRLALARAEAREALETRCNSMFCHEEMTPATLEDLRARAAARPPDRPGYPNKQLQRIHQAAVANLAAFERLVPAAEAFALVAAAHPEVRAEANLHIGYLAIRAARPDAALAPLATAAQSEDSYVRYLAEHLSGRALGALGRRAQATVAYRRALEIVPDAPVSATLLAGELFLSDDAADREEAHRVLQASVLETPRPTDPWHMYWYGDARLWPTYMERLQAELRR